MDFAQRPAGVDAKLVDETIPHPAVGVQCVGLTPAAVLREHQLSGQSFVERMGVVCRGEFVEQFGVLTGPQRDVIAVQDHREPFSLKRSAAVADPWSVDGREGLAAPQRQRAAEKRRCFVWIRGRPCLRGQVSEQVQVYR